MHKSLVNRNDWIKWANYVLLLTLLLTIISATGMNISIFLMMNILEKISTVLKKSFGSPGVVPLMTGNFDFEWNLQVFSASLSEKHLELMNQDNILKCYY